MSTDRHRFAPTTFFICGGLLIWMANFVFVYSFAALACAKRFAHLQFFSLPIVPLVTTAASFTACVATGFVMWLSMTRMRRDPNADQHTLFIRFLALSAAALALVASVWLVLPPLLVRSQC